MATGDGIDSIEMDSVLAASNKTVDYTAAGSSSGHSKTSPVDDGECVIIIIVYYRIDGEGEGGSACMITYDMTPPPYVNGCPIHFEILFI